MERGSFGFAVTDDGSLADDAVNMERLRNLWLDRRLVHGDELGDGDPGDFDFGAWHVACHLIAAGGVRRTDDGRLLWLEVSHQSEDDRYFASVSAHLHDEPRTFPIRSTQGEKLLRGSTLEGFVEGNSLGRISARAANDSPVRFNGWTRQQFDHPADAQADGGKVWEHWCTTRNLRPSSSIAESALSAYVTLAASLGDLFPAVVARGRRDYAHPQQLCALVRGGFIGRESAISTFTPKVLPRGTENLFNQADPKLALEAVSTLDWVDRPAYYMFQRRIDRFVPAEQIEECLRIRGW